MKIKTSLEKVFQEDVYFEISTKSSDYRRPLVCVILGGLGLYETFYYHKSRSYT